MIIKLTDYNGYKILVNTDNIINTKPYLDDGCYDKYHISTEIVMSNESHLYVAETANEIMEAIVKR